MKMLLVNPNRMLMPPVPPIGLEYISACLIRDGHETKILDLTFQKDTETVIDRTVSEFMPDIAGVTVRNIDSVQFPDNEFYLDDISFLVRLLKVRYGLKVIIGGAGIIAEPEGVLDYIGADYAVAGPGEGIINELLAAVQAGQEEKKIWKGMYRPSSSCARITSAIDYRQYYAAGGIAGFETHKGCSSSCIYCIEANSPVAFKRPEDVIREIRGLVESGFSQFHLCDAEFNEDLDHALEFCNALRQEHMHMQWSLYMKPANYNQKLFKLMRETGVHLITLTIDSFKKCPLYWADAEKIIFNARANGIRLVVDFLTGFPYEEIDMLSWCIDFFRRLQPDRVTINTYIRLYRPLMISRIIERDEALAVHVMGNRDDKAMIRPIFYNQIDPAKLKAIIADDRMFCIEGHEKGVNYMKT